MFKNNLCLYHTHTNTPTLQVSREQKNIASGLHVVTSRTAGAVCSPVSSQLRFFFVRNIRDADNNTEFMTRASEINK